MADSELLQIIHRGPDIWNNWRRANPLRTNFDLSATDHLKGLNLSKANLSHVDLRWTPLIKADCSGCNFRNADLMGANLRDATCAGADFTEADLQWVHFNRTDIQHACLHRTLLSGSVFIKTDARGADFTGSRIFGISVWSLTTDAQTKQANLVITPEGQSAVTVDDIEVAQFIYLLLNREKLRNVLDTITSKAVLILGRFTPERKKILDAIADQLRSHNLLPIIFDFERSASRDFTETIKTLAGLCMFVIADITNPKSAPLELQAIVPDYQIPFISIIEEGESPFSMFHNLWSKYQWVASPVSYSSPDMLLNNFEKVILKPAWNMHKNLRRAKAEKAATVSLKEFLRKSTKEKKRAAMAL